MPANVEVGDVLIDDKPYRIDILSYRGRDIIDFAPRASVPTGSVVMSDLGLYQPLVQTGWNHGNGFQWYSDALGYMRTEGNVDTRQPELAMLYTQSVSTDTDNHRKDGGTVFQGNLYTWGPNGVRKFDGTNWTDVASLNFAVNFMLSDGDYLFAFPDGARVLKSTDGTVWTNTGADANATDFKWAIIHNGYIYCGKDESNTIHYASATDLSDLEGTTADPGTIYCGIGSIPTIGAEVYAGNLYVRRQDGVWQITDDDLARKMIDYANEISSDNLLSSCVTNGYMMFPVRDRVIQWNGARVSDITPNKISDAFPYVTYGSFACFFTVDNFMYCIGRTNESPYKIALLCWDGVGWHKLTDLITNGADVISAVNYDVVNNRIWYHVDSTNDVTYYIQLSANSSFPYNDFPMTGTHSLISSRYDMGFRRAIKSCSSLWVEAENVTKYRYLSVYYQLDGDGVWYKWDDITNNGLTMLEFPSGHRTIENYFMQIRIDFITDNPVQSPILDSYTLRFIMRPDTKIGYNFNILAATQYRSATVEDDRTALEIVQDIRELRDSKKPVKMIDILGDEVWGYITAIREQPVYIHTANEQDVMDVEYYLNINFAQV